jgi:hypothetical protein
VPVTFAVLVPSRPRSRPSTLLDFDVVIDGIRESLTAAGVWAQKACEAANSTSEAVKINERFMSFLSFGVSTKDFKDAGFIGWRFSLSTPVFCLKIDAAKR